MRYRERPPARGPKAPGFGGPIEAWYVSALLLGMAVYGLGVILMPLVVAAAGHRPFRIGGVIAMQNAGLLTSPLWGQAMDRLARHRLVLIAGLLLIAAGFVGLTLCTRLGWLLGAAGLIGLGTAAATTATLVFVSGPRSEVERSARIGWLQLFNSIGTTIGLAGAGLMSVHAGTLAGAGAALLSAIMARMTLPAGAPQRQSPEPAAPRVKRSGLGLPSLLGSWFLFVVGISCFASGYPLVMHRVFGVGVRHSSAIVSAATLVGLPLYAVCAWLIRRYGSLPMLAGGIACRLFCLGGLGLLGIAAPRSHPLMLMALAGLFQASWPVVSVAANDQLFRASSLGPGLATGLFGFVAALGSGAGALLGGWVADRFGYDFVPASAAVGAALGLALLIGPLWRAGGAADPASCRLSGSNGRV